MSGPSRAAPRALPLSVCTLTPPYLSCQPPVVVVDDEDRENEGDLIFAAEMATAQLLAFMVRHTSGFVCVALAGADCDRLLLPPMWQAGQDSFGTAYTVTVDAADGVGTGI